MINMINTWAGQIVIAVIAVTILEMILPDGKNKKYIKTIIGIYILFIIIYPAINYFSADKLNFEEILSEYKTEENDIDNDKLLIETNAQVEDLYKKEISEKIISSIEQKEYTINSFKLEIELKDKQKYGEITYMEIDLFKKNNTEDKTITNEIEPVKVQLEKKKEKQNINITEDEINGLKTFLEKEYGINKDKIVIKEDFYAEQ